MSKSEFKTMQIGELAKNLGITTRTIRYYEEIGLMGKVDRPLGKARVYNKGDILRLKFILKLKSMGVSLKEGHELSKIFDQHEKDFSKITPRLIEVLDSLIINLDKKMDNLLSHRQEMSEYRVRITELLVRKGIG